MNTLNLIQRDLRHVWHPCSQMKDYVTFPPLVIKKASGSYIELENGQKIIDANSSWWCKSLGHNHPRLKKALQQQLDRFEHVLLANTTHETIVALSEKLAHLTQTLDKVFYASDGSSAVEIAMKMSLHARQCQGQSHRHRFIALQNAYHGETLATLSVSDNELYRAPYRPLLFDTPFLHPLPYVSGKTDPLWQDCSDYWPAIEKTLREHAHHATAVIVEPLVQGAGGMRMYSADLLKRLRRFTQDNDLHLIADEIMTGLGRVGLPLACQYADIEPDFLCLSKGLTAGWLPMSVVLTSDAIYQLFYDDYEKGKSFLHSHTHSGNALAASVALECLRVIEDESIYQKVQTLEPFLRELFQMTADRTGKLHNIRCIGAIVAADLIVPDPTKRVGFAVFQEAVRRGALLRPLHNTLYWLPPLNIDRATLEKLQSITEAAIRAVLL
ncbi:MAG: adenosylmethionine--8-amino-7-oxononanoate transaminase [Coxiella sp. RIFCSPHIGHO2_12_FULL_44_14]|nr:MAG: adenosylmethionine--8-amino-7-oxononanoate transaminase [Coxiella sp. RIFCSPHIGHO2_12_FULL_44_14]